MDLLRPVYGRQTYLHVEDINNLPTYGPAPIPLSQVNDLVINENELWFKHWPYGIHSSSFITVTTIWGVYKKYLNSLLMWLPVLDSCGMCACEHYVFLWACARVYVHVAAHVYHHGARTESCGNASLVEVSSSWPGSYEVLICPSWSLFGDWGVIIWLKESLCMRTFWHVGKSLEEVGLM